MADVSKIYNGEIVGAYYRTPGTVALSDFGLVDNGDFTLKADPVTRKNSNGEEIIVAYDVKLTINLMQVRDLGSLSALNNQVKEILLDDGRGSDEVYVKIFPMRLNIGVDIDFADPTKRGIKIIASKRIEAGDINDIIDFSYQEGSN